MKHLLKFVRGRNGGLVSFLPDELFLQGDGRQWVVFPGRKNKIKVEENKIYFCKIYPHPRRVGIAFAEAIEEINDPTKLYNVFSISKDGEVTLISKYYPEETITEYIEPTEYYIDGRTIIKVYECFNVKKEFVADPKRDEIPSELLREQKRLYNKIEVEEKIREKKFNDYIDKLEKQIVKTKPTVEKREISRDNIVVLPSAFGDQEFLTAMVRDGVIEGIDYYDAVSMLVGEENVIFDSEDDFFMFDPNNPSAPLTKKKLEQRELVNQNYKKIMYYYSDEAKEAISKTDSPIREPIIKYQKR